MGEALVEVGGGEGSEGVAGGVPGFACLDGGVRGVILGGEGGGEVRTIFSLALWWLRRGMGRGLGLLMWLWLCDGVGCGSVVCVGRCGSHATDPIDVFDGLEPPPSAMLGEGEEL